MAAPDVIAYSTDGREDVARAAQELADRLPEALAPLARLAYNYRWSWLPGGAELFRRVDRERCERCLQNPVRLLQEAPTRSVRRAGGGRGRRAGGRGGGTEKGSCGFGHQEAAQADGEEEAPQAAEEDARPASQQEVS